MIRAGSGFSASSSMIPRAASFCDTPSTSPASAFWYVGRFSERRLMLFASTTIRRRPAEEREDGGDGNGGAAAQPVPGQEDRHRVQGGREQHREQDQVRHRCGRLHPRRDDDQACPQHDCPQQRRITVDGHHVPSWGAKAAPPRAEVAGSPVCHDSPTESRTAPPASTGPLSTSCTGGMHQSGMDLGIADASTGSLQIDAASRRTASSRHRTGPCPINHPTVVQHALPASGSRG